MVRSLQLSFTDWDGISLTAQWVGLDNFRTVISHRSFNQIVRNTIYLMVIYIPLLNVFALFIAIQIYEVKNLGNLYKTVFFLPNMLSMTVVGFIWKLIFSFHNGIINKFFRAVGLEAFANDWLGDPSLVLPSMTMTIIWYALGYYVLIYLSGLYNIPVELYEATEVEGASSRQKFVNVTIPMLAPAITINIILSTIGLITLFDLPFVLTGGGPGYNSQTIALQIYYLGFVTLQPKLALALAVILGIFAILIIIVLMKILRKREENIL